MLRRNWRPLTFAMALLGLTGLRLWLVAALPLHVLPKQSHDDALYVRLAGALLEGAWLGSYDELTLAKGPGYPIWLALNHRLGWPLLVSQAALQAAAALAVCAALRRLGLSYLALFLLYALYLGNPFFEVRVMREGIYPSLTILSLAGLAGMYADREAGLRRAGVWTALLAAALSASWITREENAVLLPSVAILLAATLHRVWQTHGASRRLVRTGVLCAAPLLAAALAAQAVAFVNQRAYGSWALVEVNSRPFASAYGALVRVEHEHPVAHVRVPSETRARIYQASPAFGELEPHLEEPSRFRRVSCSLYPHSCPELAGGWFLWAFRDAAARAGHHRSATAAHAYYARLAAEVNRACETGALRCAPERHTVVPRFGRELVGPLLATALVGIPYTLGVPVRPYVLAGRSRHPGEPAMKQRFAWLTHHPPAWDADEGRGQARRRVLAALQRAYQRATAPLFVLALGLYGWAIATSLRRRDLPALLVVNTALLVGLVSRFALLCLIDVTSFPAFRLWPAYLTPIYPWLYLFTGLALVDGVARLRDRAGPAPLEPGQP